jgi:hypothetical protein
MVKTGAATIYTCEQNDNIGLYMENGKIRVPTILEDRNQKRLGDTSYVGKERRKGESKQSEGIGSLSLLGPASGSTVQQQYLP